MEGLDGSGKSTQIHLLKKWLEVQGLKVFFSEWNSSELVKSATSKGKNRQLLTPTTFSLIHATDFADRYERQLTPLLRAGYIVLCEDERKQWFVRPYRDAYRHAMCGTVTTMGRALSETYARDPKFYGATFCVHCNRHLPVAEFTWTHDDQPVGS